MFVLYNTGVTFPSISSDLVSESLGVCIIGSVPQKCMGGQVSLSAAPGKQNQAADQLCRFVLTEDASFPWAPIAKEESVDMTAGPRLQTITMSQEESAKKVQLPKG